MQSEHFLTEKSVAELTTFSRATINRKVAAGHFPKPLWISERRKVWKASEIERWIDAHIQAAVHKVSDQQQPSLPSDLS